MPAAPTDYALPTIHLNGTGARSLADEYHAVYQAIDRASDALAAATCNARDFYPQGAAALTGWPSNWVQARAERAEMFRKLAEVQAYAEAWMERASDHL
jgi:sucrose-6-phosphate hydrolase SacC (GH32 family)